MWLTKGKEIILSHQKLVLLIERPNKSCVMKTHTVLNDTSYAIEYFLNIFPHS
jgi:hypothetical protein